LAGLRAEIREWCRGRSWIWRAPLVLYFAWALWRRLKDPLWGDLFSGITLGIHELGHLLLAWGPMFLGVAGGSLFQVAAPVAAGFVFHRQRDWFGITVAAAWLSSSLHGLAAYVGDARARELPLLGLFPDPIHDWEWMLGRMGLLSWDRGLASVLRAASGVIGFAAVIAGGWICWEMGRLKGAASSESSPPASP